MHELHLMTQVVRMVEATLRESPGAKPSVVRLKVSTRSHLLGHDHATLQSAFALAARGTLAEHALLEVTPAPVGARCQICGTESRMDGSPVTCPTCGSGALELEEVPEAVLQEVVVEE